MRAVRGLGTVLLLSLAAAIGAQEGGDLQAQILYAYQTEDLGELGNLVQRLGNEVKAGSADAALRYHLAHANYRFGLLAEQKRRKAAAPAFSDCIDQLKPVLDQDAKSAEALALQSACYVELAKERHLEAVLLRSHAEERLKSAFELAPRRVNAVSPGVIETGWWDEFPADAREEAFKSFAQRALVRRNGRPEDVADAA